MVYRGFSCCLSQSQSNSTDNKWQLSDQTKTDITASSTNSVAQCNQNFGTRIGYNFIASKDVYGGGSDFMWTNWLKSVLCLRTVAHI